MFNDLESAWTKLKTQTKTSLHIPSIVEYSKVTTWQPSNIHAFFYGVRLKKFRDKSQHLLDLLRWKVILRPWRHRYLMTWPSSMSLMANLKGCKWINQKDYVCMYIYIYIYILMMIMLMMMIMMMMICIDSWQFLKLFSADFPLRFAKVEGWDDQSTSIMHSGWKQSIQLKPHQHHIRKT